MAQNFSMNGRVSDRNAQEPPHRRGGFSTTGTRRLPPPQPVHPSNQRLPRTGIPARLNREHAPFTIRPNTLPLDYRSNPSPSSYAEDGGYGVAFNIFPQPEQQPRPNPTRTRFCPHHAARHGHLPGPFRLLEHQQAHARAHLQAHSQAYQPPPQVQYPGLDYGRLQRDYYALGAPSPRQADRYAYPVFHSTPSFPRSQADDDNDDWRYLDEIAGVEYSSPASIRRPSGRAFPTTYEAAGAAQAQAAAAVTRPATPIPDWEEYEEERHAPFFDLEYSPSGESGGSRSSSHHAHLHAHAHGPPPRHRYGLREFDLSEGDYDEDEDGSYDPGSVLDEDEIDFEGAGSDVDGRSWLSEEEREREAEQNLVLLDDSEEGHSSEEERDSEAEEDEDASQAEGNRGLADEPLPRPPRDDSVEAIDGDREASVASVSSSEMPAVRKRNATGTTAPNSAEPATKRRRTATATPARRGAAGRAAAKKETTAGDSKFSFSDEEPEDDVIDLSKSDELPPDLLVEKPDNSIRLGKLQCVICMDDATDLTITHCGHLFCSECLHSSLFIDPVKRICPICRQKVELRQGAGGRAVNPKKTFWPLELKLMTTTRAGKQAVNR